MLDLNDELNYIIIKYDIDRRNRRFRDSLRAVELLNELVSAHGNILFLCQNSIDPLILRRDINCDTDFEYWVIDAANDNFSKNITNEKKVVVASYNYNGEVSMLLNEKGIKHICLYDYFALNGLELDYEYYNILGEGNRIFHTGKKIFDHAWYSPYDDIIYDKNKISSIENNELKKIYTEKLIFKFLFMRDFITTKQYIDDYVTKYSNDVLDYLSAWAEISVLFEKIKNAMQNRTFRDIVVFWIDSLGFGDDTNENMPFLNSQSDNALVFENAYTVTGHTTPTFKTMFLGLKTVDDELYKIKKITKNESRLIKNLYANGYDFKYYGSLGLIDSCLKSNIPYFLLTPATKIYWDFYNDMIKTESRRFYMLHEICETHFPFLSADIKKNYLNTSLKAIDKQNENTIAQRTTSDKYFDKQLDFYSSLLPNTTTKIYMSDHGRENGKLRFHVLFKVIGDNIPSQQERRMFSLLDFDKLIQYIIEPNDVSYNKLFREYVEIQDVPWYNPIQLSVEFAAKKMHSEARVGYRGVITEKEVYFRYNHGLEFYRKQKNDEILFTEERLEELRIMTGTYMNDLGKEDHFKYSQYIFKIIDKYLLRNSEYEEKKQFFLKRLFEEVGDNLNLAICNGGPTCIRLLQKIGLSLCKKIKYIIDSDPDCIAGKMGIAVINPACVNEYHIDLIINADPFRDSPSELIPELKGLNCKIIWFYDYLKANGVKCTRDFWLYEFEDSDFDVGFPFAEVNAK